jgi:nicotinamide-nucleotide amidase
MHAFILSVGNELLRGEVLDTNAHWLSQQLLERGVFVGGRATAPDKSAPIADALRGALSGGARLVLVVGGLGPTVDDLTRDGIAAAFGLPLLLDPEALDEIERRFASLGYEMPEQNRRQAEFPEGAEVLGNPWGSAPAFLLRSKDAAVIAFPGVPREMQRIFTRLVAPRLAEWFADAAPPARLVLRTFGIGESMLEDRVRDLLEGLPAAASWSSLPRDRGHCDLVITADGQDTAAVTECITLHSRLQERLGRHVYSLLQDEELDDVVHRLLLESGLTLALAESCTGGLVASRLVSHPGSSKYLDRALVTYSNRSKIDELGVLPETLESHGAVSEQTALEMARGARERAGTDLGAAVTGIAGPAGGSAEKPVGLVLYAVATPSGQHVRRRVFPGDRAQIRDRSADALLDLLRLTLSGEMTSD